MKSKGCIIFFVCLVTVIFSFRFLNESNSWIRINQLGYTPSGIKVAVWCSKDNRPISSFRLVDAATGKTVYEQPASKNFGAYGPFDNTCRLNFTAFKKPGKYYLAAGKAVSPEFNIEAGVYNGAANFCLQYMRQQRSGFNPYLKDSCHTNDGYTMYGPMPDSTHIDASGGWHDASDYLQYSTTSANATWHLLAAYRDFASVFDDEKMANGLDGKNGVKDILDEAGWGLEWLMKMNPAPDQVFNQLADDRDHRSMRIPKEDSFYGKGNERPVYFITGEPQGLFKYKNRTTGTSSTAAKFASAFALAQYLYNTDSVFKVKDKNKGYYARSFDAYQFALKRPGVTQTAPGGAPYFYEEDNWVDDMELAAASIHDMVNTTPGSSDNGYYRSTSYDYGNRKK